MKAKNNNLNMMKKASLKSTVVQQTSEAKANKPPGFTSLCAMPYDVTRL